MSFCLSLLLPYLTHNFYCDFLFKGLPYPTTREIHRRYLLKCMLSSTWGRMKAQGHH